MLIWLDAPLFLGLSLLVPCFIVNLKYFQPKIGAVAEATQHKTSDILGFFIERFDNIKLVQSYNTYRHESDKLGRRQGELFDLEMRSTALNLSAGSIASFIMSLAPVVILGWGGHQVMQGALGLGALIAFFQYFMRIFGPLENLNQLYIDCVRASVSLRRIVEFMDVPAEIDAELGQAKPFSFKNKIAFKDVEFAYNGHPVLCSFDLELEKGKTYALVGASGCGKSTVVDLLCRFYQPQKGEIAIDDAPCRAFGLGKYRDRIGLVSQFDMVLQEGYSDLDPDIIASEWHSRNARNWSGYVNAEVDRLIEAGRVAYDENAHIAIYRNIHRHLLEDHPTIFICREPIMYAVRQPLRGLESIM
ncbi:MAG: ATP-binding cassette domain-containing protein, partial [Gemmatimonadetes bacterium]|nr:ATP-binding cassette domain-containing protein [Gemmatimonadota bacterium]